MKYNTQNEKIAAITENTLVVGIDIGSEIHYARAFDYRGVELSEKPLMFTNTEAGFDGFMGWIGELRDKYGKTDVIPGMEPTGHYWFNLASFLIGYDMRPVHVNPYHVKRSKELDDNNPSKNDRKDPMVIAKLVIEGRYLYPYIPVGVYAEIRSLSNQKMQAKEALTRIKNRLAKWFSVYFPEYKDVYKNPEAKSGLMILRKAPLPADIVRLGTEGVNRTWREAKLRGAGRKRADALVKAAEHTIGSHEAPMAASMELLNLLDDVERYSNRIDKLGKALEEKVKEIPYAENLLEIQGIGVNTVCGFVAEVGDIRRFDDPKQLQKLAGYAIVNNESGKHKGESHISHRGRKRLRYVLYEAALSVSCKNEAFREIHRYYTTRDKNPLKKMQSIVAVACKLIRIFYVILTKGVHFDGTKMLDDIRRPLEDAIAA